MGGKLACRESRGCIWSNGDAHYGRGIRLTYEIIRNQIREVDWAA